MFYSKKEINSIYQNIEALLKATALTFGNVSEDMNKLSIRLSHVENQLISQEAKEAEKAIKKVKKVAKKSKVLKAKKKTK